MRTLKLTLAYDGTRFVGWQRQAEGDSIQGLLEDALARFEGAPVTVHGAGRTDAGVHALGQVASAQLACVHDVETLTARAQRPASRRCSCARGRGGVAGVSRPLQRPLEDLSLSDSERDGSPTPSSARTSGTCQSGSTSMRCARRPAFLSARTTSRRFRASAATRDTRADGHAVRRWQPIRTAVLTYEISGDGFLRHMVRAIVGTLVEIGRGWREPDCDSAVAAGSARARGRPDRAAPRPVPGPGGL